MEQTFEREVLDRLKTIEIKMDSYGDVKAKTYENERRILLLENELKDTQAEIKQQQAEAIAAIITGVIGIGIAFLRLGIGV